MQSTPARTTSIIIIILIQKFVSIASKVDWRTPSANFEDEDRRTEQMRFRGSGGYSQYWQVLYDEFVKSDDSHIKKYVSQLS